MNTYEVDQQITIQNKTYKIISVTVNSETERPSLFREGFWQNLFVTVVGNRNSKRIYSVNILTNGQITRPRAI